MDIRVKISQQLSIFEVYHRMTGRVQNDQKWVFNLFTLEMLRARSRAKIYVTFEKAHLFFRLSKQNIYTETKLYAKNFLSSTVVPLCHLFLNKRVIYYTCMIYSSLKRISFNNEIQCFTVVTNTQNHTFDLRAVEKKVVFFHFTWSKSNATGRLMSFFRKKNDPINVL